jgi:hypothetical protein
VSISPSSISLSNLWCKSLPSGPLKKNRGFQVSGWPAFLADLGVLEILRIRVRAGNADIAGYLKTLVLDNRTTYHGYFDFLHLETGFELSSSWLNDSCYGLNRNRSGLIFMRWTHIDLGAQDLNGIQRPKLFFQNSWK